MERENEKILEALQALHCLIYKDKEWGGRVNRLTGEVEGLREGERGSFPVRPEEEVVKGAQGWRGFHSHSVGRDPMPTLQDFCSVYFCGSPIYMLTIWGIWEVRAMKNVPPDEVKQLLKSALERAEKDSKNEREVNWRLEDEIRKVLPVKATLFPWQD